MKTLINDDEEKIKINYAATKTYLLASQESKNLIDGLETLHHSKEVNRKIKENEKKG